MIQRIIIQSSSNDPAHHKYSRTEVLTPVCPVCITVTLLAFFEHISVKCQMSHFCVKAFSGLGFVILVHIIWQVQVLAGATSAAVRASMQNCKAVAVVPRYKVYCQSSAVIDYLGIGLEVIKTVEIKDKWVTMWGWRSHRNKYRTDSQTWGIFLQVNLDASSRQNHSRAGQASLLQK